jgi:hypothetical protein
LEIGSRTGGKLVPIRLVQREALAAQTSAKSSASLPLTVLPHTRTVSSAAFPFPSFLHTLLNSSIGHHHSFHYLSVIRYT